MVSKAFVPSCVEYIALITLWAASTSQKRGKAAPLIANCFFPKAGYA